MSDQEGDDPDPTAPDGPEPDASLDDADDRTGEDREWIDLPLKVPRPVAAEILAELEDGRTVEAELDPDAMPHLAERLRWQLDNDRRIAELVDDYDGD